MLVFGLLTLATIPLYDRAFAYPHSGSSFFFISEVPDVAGLPGARFQSQSYLLWLVAAPLCYVLCAWWYHRRAQRAGVARRWRSYIVVGLGLFAFVSAINLIPATAHRSGHSGLGGQASIEAVLSPLVAVAAGLLVLAWTERSWVVAAVSTAFGGLTIMINLNPPTGVGRSDRRPAKRADGPRGAWHPLRRSNEQSRRSLSGRFGDRRGHQGQDRPAPGRAGPRGCRADRPPTAAKPQVRQISRPRMRRRATRKSSRQGQLVTRCSVGLRPERVRWPGTAR